MTQHLTPFDICARLIGPPEAIAEACGLSAKAPYAWRFEASTRGAGDLPSAPVMRRLLSYSSARNLGLTEKHLIWGADAAEIEEILAARRGDPALAAE
ncbi:hypothetical protein D2T31_00510 [Sinirhodobacter populi]|uniref:Uncharacterized protein n=1 Tax=Paenirhodobacter populi TaxID=2306993 RepID=A0A443KIB8_9RHOB|nr:hypothetical protein [Sinirhodobacter populi]RWR32499.1 hypothetical protein D2T31_00510 [Sinirhodobacter populi]